MLKINYFFHFQIKNGTMTSVTCNSVDGDPAPELSAVVSSDPGGDIVNRTLKMIQVKGATSTVFQFVPRIADEGLYLTCLGTQRNRAGDVLSVERSSEVIKSVVHKPYIIEGPLDTDFSISEVKTLTFKFRSNPLPRVDQIHWNTVSNASGVEIK